MTATSQNSHRYVLRTTIEFTTPFLVGAGRAGDTADAVFVADPNGLPAIPGSSLAGVLRSTFRSAHGQDETERLFGFQRGDDGKGSRVALSWACIHDSYDQPVEGIVDPERLDDPVLAIARSPAVRDHVRINDRGASDAANRGKFDEQAICAGQRFTFEIELTGNERDQLLWDSLLAVLCCPALRLGGKSRRGFGSFRIVRLAGRTFDLRKDFEAYRNHPVSLAANAPALRLIETMPETAEAPPVQRIAVSLKPEGYWMFGGGYDLECAQGEADMTPVRDARIRWDENRGTVLADQLVLPASGIKGALSHRTAFHYNALSGCFADASNAGGNPRETSVGENNPAVRDLFGYCKGLVDEDDSASPGQRGRVLLDDIYLSADPPSQLVHHVGIDRFTGGARDQVLFCERPLWQGPDLFFDIHLWDIVHIRDDKALKAFRMALEDLTEGRLQLGAGSGRGLGFFKGTFTWPNRPERKGAVS